MGQFLLVQGDDPATVRDLFDRGLAVFETTYGAVPDGVVGDVAGEATTRAAHFPRLLVRGAGVVRDEGRAEWGLGAGTWRVTGAGTAEPALRRLVPALCEGGDLMHGALRGLDGAFVVAAGAGRTGDVVLLTDRIGALHAYRATWRGCAVVSTSAIVVAALGAADWDPDAVREFLAAHSVFDDRSLWRGVEKLPAATLLRLRGGRETSRVRWWSLADACWDRAVETPGPRELTEALVADVDHWLSGHARAVFDLTGGFDSRILVGSALRSGRTFSTLVNGVADDENVRAANAIALEMGLDHRNQVPGRDFPFPEMEHFERACLLGDGEANVFDYAPTLLAHTASARSFGLALNGSFGEVCRGYWWDALGLRLRSRRRFDARRFAAARFATDTWADRIAPAVAEGTSLDHFTGVVERAVADLDGLPATAKADAVYLRVRMQRWHGRIASLVSRLRPTVAPFASREPLEAALAMTAGTRWGGHVPRHVLESLDPRLAALPLANGAPAFPLRLSNLHRHGALARETGRRVLRRVGIGRPSAPLVWRAGDVWRLPELADLLRPASMRTAAFYDRAMLESLIEQCRRDRAAPAATLGRIVTIELAARVVAKARVVSNASVRV